MLAQDLCNIVTAIFNRIIEWSLSCNVSNVNISLILQQKLYDFKITRPSRNMQRSSSSFIPGINVSMTRQ